MRDTEESPDDLAVIRAVLAQATQCLIARHHCSAVEARERIEREAMAKRAPLNDVARAIVFEETVSYRPVAPARK
jgi:AmiR/NasT family two-component response regulator